jgi:UPF0716 protein FxsA
VFLVVALLVIVPIVELFVFVQVAEWIGGVEALLLLLAISLLGFWLVKAQGVAVYRRFRGDLAEQRVPGRPIVDGLLVFSGGVLLLVPGFVTAIVGLVLLIPPTRVPIREHLIRRWTRTARAYVQTSPGRTVITTESVVVTDRRGPTRGSDPQELGRNRALEAGDEPLG